jgi:hypothetical protein
MAKAKRVHSTPPTNTPIDTTRRPSYLLRPAAPLPLRSPLPPWRPRLRSIRFLR